MKTDFYTKVVLTVIAVCLIIIVFKNMNFVSVANANPVSLPVQKEVMDVRIVGIDYYIKIPVEIKSSETIPVKIEEVGSVYRALPVKIKD